MNGKTMHVQKGTWGGEHIGLWIEDSHARIEYDCAHGTIDQPIKIDRRGRFNVTGTHIRERGGPESAGKRPDSHPVRYIGQVNGRTMMITITLTDTKETVGTYTLTYGEEPRVFKCK